MAGLRAKYVLAMLTWVLLSALPVIVGTESLEKRQGTLFGFSICSIADLDGDGVRDLAVGDPFAADWRGEVAVLSGRTGRLIRLLVSDGNRVALGWSIEAATTATGAVLWAVAAAGMVARHPYVEVFEGRGSRAVMRLEAPAHEHEFGHRIAFWPGDSDGSAVIVLASVRGGLDGSEGTWKLSAWSVPDGAELWALSAGSWNRDLSPWLWIEPLGKRGSNPAIFTVGSFDALSKPVMARLDPHSGEHISKADPLLGREDPSSLAFLNVDGDGVPDLLRGYASETGEGPGEVVLISGATKTVIRRHTGEHPGWGANVAALGDLDCDGIDDYAIASHGLIEPGIVSVHSGADGTTLHSWTGDPARIGHQHFGEALRVVDDLDSDGVRDVVVGSTNPFAPGEGGSVWAYSGCGGELLWSVER